MQGREGLEGGGGDSMMQGTVRVVVGCCRGGWQSVAGVGAYASEGITVFEGHGALVGPTCGWCEVGLSSHGCWGVVAKELRARCLSAGCGGQSW
jgi:hypothetical protein